MPKISQLPTDSSPTLTDYVPVLDQETTTTKRSLLSSIRDLVFDNIPSASSINTGWLLKNPSSATLPTPNTVTHNGNRSYDVVFNSVDMTSYISTGMRMRFTRTTSVPNQCTSLNGSNQYFNKTSPSGITFTDDFVVSAWIKLTSYSNTMIVSRYNGTSGWYLNVTANGNVLLAGLNGGSSNFSYVQSHQSIPLNKWVHVAAQLDMSAFTATSTTSYVMIDGIDVPCLVSRGGTNPTALVQAGNLEVGSYNGGTLNFPGKIAQVGIFSAKVTQATIRSYMTQGLVGNETSLVTGYSLSNSVNDLTANANNLTAQNSATTTNSDSPFGLQGDGTISTTLTYGIVTKTAFSTNTTITVQCYEGNTIPTSGISAIAYSGQRAPYLFPNDRLLFSVYCLKKTADFQSSPVTNTWYNLTNASGTAGGTYLTVPIGAWDLGYRAFATVERVSAGGLNIQNTLSTGASTESDIDYTLEISSNAAVGVGGLTVTSKPIVLSSATVYYLNTRSITASAGTIYNIGSRSTTFIFAHLNVF